MRFSSSEHLKTILEDWKDLDTKSIEKNLN